MSTLSWAKTFNIGSIIPSLNNGDKLILPSSALEELLGAVGTPSADLSDSNSFDALYGLPSQLDQTSKHVLPSPLTFQIYNPKTRLISHGGVKEFSAEAGTIHIPEWLMRSLELNEGAQINLRLKELPKGTWARFRPLSPDYTDIADFRAAFEAYLRSNYNTLTAGEIFVLRHGHAKYDFLIEELKPEKAVCVTDTDLEVDIVPMEEGVQEKVGFAGKTFGIAGGKNATRNGELVINGPGVSGTVANEEYQYFTVSKLEHLPGNGIQIDLSVETGGDADLLVSPINGTVVPPPTLTSHFWSQLSYTPSLTTNTKSIIIPPTNSDLVASTSLKIGVYNGGFASQLVSFTLTITYIEDSNVAIAPQTLSITDSNTNDPDSSLCQNCGNYIPTRTFTMHEVFCIRNNSKCDRCGKVIKKSEIEQHWHCDSCGEGMDVSAREKHSKLWHTKISCDLCSKWTGEGVRSVAMHKLSDCEERLIICRYCHNLMAQGPPPTTAQDLLAGLSSHESYCGGRTITCQRCSQPVKIRDIQVHTRHHEYERQARKLPPLCANECCVRPVGQNVLGLCSSCFGPFWASMDDPDHSKLLQRVARKIHSQMTIGCGNSWCRNMKCATASGEKMDPVTAASALIPMIAALQQNLTSQSFAQKKPAKIWLCVDELVTRKKFLAEILENELGGKFALTWCVKGLELEKEDIEKAKAWVEKEAPRK